MHWRDRLMRRPAMDELGNAHELTFACYHNYPLLLDDPNCEYLADAMNEARCELDFAIWAYVLMPDHVQLLVVPRQMIYEVKSILSAVKESAARQAIDRLSRESSPWLPRITVKNGKRMRRRFWQPGGGFDRNAVDPRAILKMIEYIHNNPVRKGLVAKPEEWRWSSAGWFEGKNSLKRDPIDFGGLVGFVGGKE